MSLLAIYIDFLEYGELTTILIPYSLEYVLIGARLPPLELVAWKCEHLKAIVTILFVCLYYVSVLLFSEWTLTSNVYNQGTLLVVKQIT